ncbi:MAG: LamG domain-containing protein, partial [Candidatus Omnitrophica bacterium]|nr:LamG domain-containing protein [Candidatus Omnitrophota bacterium]
NAATIHFRDAANRDLHLLPTSPYAIDQGAALSSDSKMAFSIDVDGFIRPYNGTWDIGADEMTQKSFADEATGNWNSGPTWGNTGSTEGVDYPGGGDTAVIDAYVVTLTNNHGVSDINIQGSGRLAMGGFVLGVDGDLAISGGGVLTAQTSTVVFRAAVGTQTITSNSQTYNRVTMDDSGHGATFQPADNLDVTSVFLLTDGTLDLATNNVDLKAAGNFTLSGGNFLKGTGTTHFAGNMTYTDNIGINLGELYIGASPETVNLASDLIADSLTINLTDILNTNGYDLNIGGIIDINGTLDATDDGEGDNTTIYLEGDWDATDGSFIHDTSSVTFDGTSADQNITSNGSSFYNLVLNNSAAAGSNDFNLMDDLDVNNTLTISDGDLDNSGGSYDITIGGSWILASSSTFIAGTSSVEFDDASKNSTVYGSTAFYNLFIDTPNKWVDFEAGTTTTVSNAFTIDGQTGGSLVQLKSKTPGSQWTINTPIGTADVEYAFVKDSVSAIDSITAYNTVNDGNNVFWIFGAIVQIYFDDAADGNWTDFVTWGKAAGSVMGVNYPGPGQVVTIDSHTVTVNADASALAIDINDDNEPGGTDVELIDSGYDVFIYGNIDIENTIGIVTSTGSWFLGNDGNVGNANSDNTLANFVVSDLSTATIVGSTLYVDSLTLEADCHISGDSVYISGISTHNIVDMHSNSSITLTDGLQLEYNDSVDLNQSFINTSSTVEFFNANNSTITMTGDITTGDLLFRGDSSANTEASAFKIDLNGNDLTVNGDFTLGNSTAVGYYASVDFSSGTHIVTGDLDIDGSSNTWGYLNFNSSRISLGGNVDLSRSTVYEGTSTVTFNPSSGVNLLTASSQAIRNLTINGAAAAIIRPVGDMDINGNFILTNGSFDLATNNNDIKISGNLTLNGGAFIKGTGTVNFDGNMTYDDNIGSTNLGILYIGGSPETINLASDLVADALTINYSDRLNTNGYDLDIGGMIDINGTLDATADVELDRTTIAAGGSWDMTGGTFTYAKSSVTFDSATTGNIITSDGNTFYDIVFNDGGGNSGGWAMSDSIIIANSLTVSATDSVDGFNLSGKGVTIGANFVLGSAGEVTPGEATITLVGNWTLYPSAEFTGGTSTVVFTAGDNGNTIRSSGQTFYDIAFNNAAGSWVLSDGMDVNGGFTLAASAAAGVNLSGYDLTVDGNMTIADEDLFANNSDIIVGGSWTMAVNSFEPGVSTVMLIGTDTDNTITSNSETFNNLTINDGLVGYWKLDESTATTDAKGVIDHSGYRNTGTWKGDPTASTTTPYVNFVDPYSLDFDGTGDYVEIADSSALNIPSSWTLAAWVNVSTVVSDSTLTSIIAKGDFNSEAAGDNGNYFIILSEGLIGGGYELSAGFEEADGTDQVVAVSGLPPTTGVWAHVACVFDDSANTITLYVSGNQLAQTTNVTAVPAQNDDAVEIGDDLDNILGVGEYFNGFIDEVRIYNRALSAAEIKRLGMGDQPQTASGKYTLQDALNVDGDFTFGGGELDVNGNNINVRDSWWNYGGIFDEETQTVTLDGTTSGHVIQSGSESFYTLVMNGASGAWTLYDDLEATNALTLTNGTLTHSTDLAVTEIKANTTLGGATFTGVEASIAHVGNLTISSGTYTAPNRYLTLNGNFDSATGTFVPGNATVIFNAADTDNTITTNSETFYNFNLGDGLIGYWKLDETAEGDCAGDGSNYDACDSSGFGNHGEWVGSIAGYQETARPFRFYNAGNNDFPGTDDYIVINQAADLNPKNEWTVSAWIYLDDATGDRQIYSIGSSGESIATNVNTGLGVSDGTVFAAFEYGSAGTDVVRASATALTAYRWYHLAGVYTGSDIHVYIDGVLDDGVLSGDTASYSPDTTSSVITIGAFGAGELDLDGNVDDLRVYNRALSANEIKAIAWSEVHGDNDNTYALQDALDVDENVGLYKGTLVTGGQNINVGGNWTNIDTTYTGSTSSVTFDAIESGHTIQTNDQTFHNVVFDDGGVDGGGWSLTLDALETGNLFTVTASDSVDGVNLDGYDLTVAGNFTVAAAGEVTASNSTINVAGSWDSENGTFNMGTSTVTLSGTGTIDTPFLAGTANFYDLNAAAASQTTTIDNNIGVDNFLTVGTGTLSGSSYIQLYKDSGTPFVHGGATISLDRIVYYPSSASQTINVTAGDYGSAMVETWPQADNITFNLAGDITTTNDVWLVASNSETGTTFNTQNNNITAGGLFFGGAIYTGDFTLNLGSSTVDLGSNGFYVDTDGGTHIANMGTATISNAGVWTMQDGTGQITVDYGTSTVTFDGTTDQTVTSGGQTFYNLIINNTGGSVDDDIILADSMEVDNNITITDGDLQGGSYSINVAGLWTMATAGTFTAGTSTVEFDDASKVSTIYGATTFYEMLIDTASKRV